MLRRGDRDGSVTALRHALAALGLLPLHAGSGSDTGSDAVLSAGADAAVDAGADGVLDAEAGGVLDAEADRLPAATDLDLFDADVDRAVRTFQQQRGLNADGIVGPSTERELTAARWRLGDRTLSYTLAAPMSGDDVTTLQSRFSELGYNIGRVDGVFAERLDAAVREFQRHRGIAIDGVFGPKTLRELQRISPMARGGRPQYLRELDRVRQSGPSLSGKRIVIDPAHGGADRGWVVEDLSGADITFDTATRLAARMTAAGMQPMLTRGPEQYPSAAERAAFANNVAADLVISLHVDGSVSAQASGIATFHFGTDTGPVSSVGEMLATLVQRELVARTGMVDCRVHHRPWEILRRTQMPAVQVELGYLTNAFDRALLAEPALRDRIAEGLLVAVKRLYLDGRDDRPTGTFSFYDLLEYERSVHTP